MFLIEVLCILYKLKIKYKQHVPCKKCRSKRKPKYVRTLSRYEHDLQEQGAKKEAVSSNPTSEAVVPSDQSL